MLIVLVTAELFAEVHLNVGYTSKDSPKKQETEITKIRKKRS